MADGKRSGVIGLGIGPRLAGLLIGAALMVLSGCASIAPPTTGPVVACDAPCWNGITPGVTRLDEARALLRSAIHPPEALNESVFVDGSIDLSWHAPNRALNSVGVVNDVVQLISIIPDDLTAEDVMARYGPPPVQLALQRQGSERVLYAVTWLYPELGLSVLLPTGRTSLLRPAAKAPVQPTTRVSALRYLAPGTAESLVAGLPEVRRASSPVQAQNRLRPWGGWGDESLPPFDIPAN